LKGCERYAAARIESNTFTLEQTPLYDIVSGGRADCALRIYDALPRNGRARRQCVQRITDETRLSRQTGETRHLPIRSYPAARYAQHYVVNALVQAGGRFGVHTAFRFFGVAS
jgi:hypothetical protein